MLPMKMKLVVKPTKRGGFPNMKLANIEIRKIFRLNNKLYWKVGDLKDSSVVCDLASGDCQTIPAHVQVDSVDGEISVKKKGEIA